MTAETDYVPYYKPGKLTILPFKTCVYKTKNDSGKTIVGRGKTDFIDKKYYEKHKSANYNFEVFGSSSSSNESNYFSGETYNDTKMLSRNDNNVIETNAIISDKKYTNNSDLFIDVDNDGINDFIVEPLSKSYESKELNTATLTTQDDPNVITIKRN